LSPTAPSTCRRSSLAPAPAANTGGNFIGGINLDDFEASTLNVPSSAGLPLIAPGDHLNSYLWRKLDGTHLDVGGNGIRMPSGAPLSDAEIGRVGAYIDALGR